MTFVQTVRFGVRICFALIVVCVVPLSVQAQSLEFTTTLSDTGISAPTNVTIRFRVRQALDGGNALLLQFDPAFLFPSTFQYQDVDLQVDGVQRPLSATPASITSGVTFSSSTMRIVLGATASIDRGRMVELSLGTHAVFEHRGTHQLRTPSRQGVYPVSLSFFTFATESSLVQSGQVVILPHLLASAYVAPRPRPPVTATSDASGGSSGRSTVGSITALPHDVTEPPLNHPPTVLQNVLPEVLMSEETRRDIAPLHAHAKEMRDFALTQTLLVRGAYDARFDENHDGRVTLQDASIQLSKGDAPKDGGFVVGSGGGSTTGHPPSSVSQFQIRLEPRHVQTPEGETIVLSVLIDAPSSPFVLGRHYIQSMKERIKNYFGIGTVLAAEPSESYQVGVNLVDVKLAFLPEHLEVLRVNQGGSSFPVWLEKPLIDAKNGTIHLMAGRPHPGVIGADAKLADITLRTRRAGEFGMEILPESVGYISDGRGTIVKPVLVTTGQIINTSRSVRSHRPNRFPVVSIDHVKNPALDPGPSSLLEETFYVDPPKIQSFSHPDPVHWYETSTIALTWSSLPGAEYSFVLDHLSDTIPDTRGETDQTVLSVPHLKDGVWYFHLRGGRGNTWSDTSHFRVQIDTVPPEPFEPQLLWPDYLFQHQYGLLFDSTDAMSGIAYWEIQEATRVIRLPQGPYIFIEQDPGKVLVNVTAVDAAGNRQSTFFRVSLPFSQPHVRRWASVFIGFGVGLSGLWMMLRLIQRRNQ